MVLVDLLHELVFRHSFGRVIYTPSLVLEGFDGLRTNVFKKKEPEMLVFHWMKDFWLTEMHGYAGAPPLVVLVKTGGNWRDRDGR